MSNDKFEVESVSISDGPTIVFKFYGDTVRAECAGADLYAEVRGDGGLDLRVKDATGEVLADLVVNPRSHRNLTENVIDIGSALLWSHWRWTQASSTKPPMSGDVENLTGAA